MYDALSQTVECPPFPKLKWDGYFWTAADRLPAWAGTQSCGGVYCSFDSDSPSDGTVQLHVHSESSRILPTSAQAEAYQYIKANDAVIARTILHRIFDTYPAWQSDYRDFLGDDLFDECMPSIHKVADLNRLVGLGTVIVHDHGEGDAVYCGFEMGCTWDDEHGLGVLMLRDRIIAIGQADVAI